MSEDKKPLAVIDGKEIWTLEEMVKAIKDGLFPGIVFNEPEETEVKNKEQK